METNRSDRLGAIVAGALVVLLALPGQAQTTSAEKDGEPEESTRPATLEITFEELGVSEKKGRLVVHYRVEKSSWKSVERHDLRLWFHLRIPTESNLPDDTYSYTLPLEGRSGETRFPRWLARDSEDEIGICLMGTGTGDDLGLGRGYVCDETRWQRVYNTWSRGPIDRITVELKYKAGPPYIPYAPWTEPTVPDFPGPFDELPTP